MQPLVHLMSALLTMSASTWDAAQVLAQKQGKPILYRIVERSKEFMTTLFWSAIWILMFDASQWSFVHHTKCSTAVAGLILRLLLLGAGAVFYELEAYHSRYPVRLFRILDPLISEVELQAILDDPECIWDEWTLSDSLQSPGLALSSLPFSVTSNIIYALINTFLNIQI